MTIALVAGQTAANHSSTDVHALTVTLDNPVTAGNCVVACIGGYNINVVESVVSAASADNWVLGESGDVGPSTAEVWIDPDCAAGHTTFSASVTNSGLIIMQVFEFSGVATSSPADVTTSGGSGALVTSWSSGTSATASAGDLLVGMCCGHGGGGTYTLSGPSSPWINETPVATSLGGIWARLVAGYQVLGSSAALTYSGTATVAQDYAAAGVALKAAGGGGGGGGSGSGSFLPFF